VGVVAQTGFDLAFEFRERQARLGRIFDIEELPVEVVALVARMFPRWWSAR
jgi:hypothetical protein